MRKTISWLVFLGCGALGAAALRADPLDDLLAGLRSGAVTQVDPAKRAEILKATGAASAKAFDDAIVELYLWEIKASVVDDEHHGGWPYRSFLVYRPQLRELLTKALKERYEAQPDGLLAFALICPAIYARDARLVESLQAYLKDNDSFLYELQAKRIDEYWRPFIKDVLAAEGGGADKPIKKG